MGRTKYEGEVFAAEKVAAERRRQRDMGEKQVVPGSVEWLKIYRAQTAMLQQLSTSGQRADFSPTTVQAALDAASLPGPRRAKPEPRWSGSLAVLPLGKYHGKPCPYCNKDMLIGTARPPTRDHKVPRSRKDVPRRGVNILIVCGPCNNDKDSMTLEEWAADLTRRGDLRAGFVQNLIDRGG
jgi:hypothetical protein